MSTDLLAAPKPTTFSLESLAAALNRAPGAVPALVAAPVAVAAIAEPALAHVLAEPAPDEDVAERRAGMLVFRVGRELFAAALEDVEEAIELPEVTPLPEMPSFMLGVMRLRGALLPIYSPAHALGVLAGLPQAALVVRDGETRIALAVDDIDDVMDVLERELRPSPDPADATLVRGVARRGAELVSAVHVPSLVAACTALAQEAA